MPEATRPLITFAVFAYNQEDVIAEAVEGAFAQTYSPLEIILSDDGSSDGTFEILAKMAAEYDGPHTVRARRSPQNRGLLGHINDVAAEAKGEIIVMAAGDDVSLPERTEVLAEAIGSSCGAAAAFSGYSVLGSNEKIAHGWAPHTAVSLAEIAFNCGGVAKGATYAYRTHCLRWPRPIPESLFSEDRILPLRAAVLGDVIPLAESLVSCREAVDSMGKRLVRERRLPVQNDQHISALLEDLRSARIERELSVLTYFTAASLISLRRIAHRMGQRRGNAGDLIFRVAGRTLKSLVTRLVSTR